MSFFFYVLDFVEVMKKITTDQNAHLLGYKYIYLFVLSLLMLSTSLEYFRVKPRTSGLKVSFEKIGTDAIFEALWK